MKKIKRENSSVVCHDGCWEYLNNSISSSNYSKIFVLVDTETKKHCLPIFLEKTSLYEIEIITIPVGEIYKTIETSLFVWNALSKKGADRQSLIINLGGGVVTDLGGFVASTYQRGISFVNIPTSLLAMVDASVGGKNGVDLGSLKNQIGVIKDPKAVIVDSQFLKTLPKEHITSGMAEMIKHGLISSEKYLNKTWGFTIDNIPEAEDLIWRSVRIKNDIVTQDPTEKGLRKTLNYGHTLGHAIESYCLEHPKKPTLLHGEAIAIGLILETYISSEMFGFSNEKLNEITNKLLAIFPKVSFNDYDIDEIIKLLIFDKKNTHGTIQFVLLTDIGKSKTNCVVSNDILKKAFKFYKNFIAK
ncbi:MAG: 3-dehydroquinate synthase [Flavobacteriaceae bacterium]|nr:3-dehydroquinate synthase [Flavobacteriaceae bacterium]|tara:strand:+ start:329 stop:1405 length:1077 start_codon:yes stop_codon:yes gene_type:complete